MATISAIMMGQVGEKGDFDREIPAGAPCAATYVLAGIRSHR
jgi:hypothetical protein